MDFFEESLTNKDKLKNSSKLFKSKLIKILSTKIFAIVVLICMKLYYQKFIEKKPHKVVFDFFTYLGNLFYLVKGIFPIVLCLFAEHYCNTDNRDNKELFPFGYMRQRSLSGFVNITIATFYCVELVNSSIRTEKSVFYARDLNLLKDRNFIGLWVVTILFDLYGLILLRQKSVIRSVNVLKSVELTKSDFPIENLDLNNELDTDLQADDSITEIETQIPHFEEPVNLNNSGVYFCQLAVAAENLLCLISYFLIHRFDYYIGKLWFALLFTLLICLYIKPYLIACFKSLLLGLEEADSFVLDLLTKTLRKIDWVKSVNVYMLKYENNKRRFYVEVDSKYLEQKNLEGIMQNKKTIQTLFAKYGIREKDLQIDVNYFDMGDSNKKEEF